MSDGDNATPGGQHTHGVTVADLIAKVTHRGVRPDPRRRGDVAPRCWPGGSPPH